MNRRVLLFLFVVLVAGAAVFTTWLNNRMTDLAKASSPLDPRSFEDVGVVFVGTGGSYANSMRRGPAVLIGSGKYVVLLDAGRDIAEGLRSLEIPLTQPAAVYLTSLLPENTVGLDDLLSTGLLAGRKTPLRVVGPPGTAALVEGLRQAARAGLVREGKAFGLPPAGAEIQVTERGDAERFKEGPFSVRTALLPGGPVPALAYRFEQGRASVVLGGVAWGGKELVELARGARLLVHEAFFAQSVEMAIQVGALDPKRLRKEASFRTPLETAGERARQAGVDSLALVRLRPPPLFAFQARDVAAKAFQGSILVPDDGDEVSLKP